MKRIVQLCIEGSKRTVLLPYELFLDIRSTYYQKKWNKKQIIEDKIRVGFIVQMPEIWDKEKPVYSMMSEDSLFDIWMIIVPKYDFEHNKLLSHYEDERIYFEKESKDEKCILAFNNEHWIDIEQYHFDYLFYQRPYDNYLPATLKSENTIKSSRICYIPYATPAIKADIIYPRSFFRNIYLGFMEDERAAKHNNRRFVGRRRSSFLNIGYPAFQSCMRLKKKCEYKSVLWTPRWSYDSVVGGSHFLEYNDSLTQYPWGNKKLIVRPHPLMWENFLKTRKMTKEQIDQTLQKWGEKGIVLDGNESVLSSLDNADILISDTSSLIPMFFITKKPIIYCPKDDGRESFFATILPGLYLAHNWNELNYHLTELLNGRDPKADLRETIVEKHFEQHKEATNNIVKEIVMDANKFK